MGKCLKVYNVIEGPISTHDVPDWTEDHGWFIVALVEQENGSLQEEEVVFDTFNEAYEVVKWFKGQVTTFELWDHV